MFFGSLLSLPAIIALIFPTISVEFNESANFFFSYNFVFVVTLLTSFFNGFGEGIS